MASETVLLKIQADNKQALTSIDKINKKLQATEEQGKKNNSVFSKMGAIIGGIAIASGLQRIASASINTASRMQEISNKVNAVFGNEGQKTIENFAKTYSKMTGLSAIATQEQIADVGSLMQAYGMTDKKAIEFGKTVVKMTNDLASFHNINKAESIRIMASALRGETESAQRFGASIMEADLNITSLGMGFGKYSAKMDEATKKQIRLQTIIRQNPKAIGDVMRSQGSYIAQTDRMNTAIEKLSLMMGKFLIPTITTLVTTIALVIDKISDNIDIIIAVTSAIGVSVTAYALYYLWINRVALATKAVTAVQWLYNAALTANPIGIIVVAIGALVGSLIYFYNTNEKVRYAFIFAWESMKSAINGFMNVFILSMNGYIRIYNRVADLIGKPMVAEIEFRAMNNASDIAKIAQAKTLTAKSIGISGGGSTTTNGGGLPFQAGSPANNTGESGSYFKTFNKVGASSSTSGSGKVTTGDITINITQNADENTDELLDRLTYKIANEFNRAAKISGVI